MRNEKRFLDRRLSLENENKPNLKVSLDAPKVIKEIPAYQVSVSEIEIEYFVDSPADKTVEAYAKKIGKIVLWEGDAYDAIGDWTTANVEARIKELYK
jgi:hypothetical protein